MVLAAVDSLIIATEFSPWVVAVGAVLAGFGAGVLSALLGIGGAIVTTPAVRALGATPIESIGSTVPAILPGAISGAYRYAKEGLVEWRLALSLGAAGAAFSVLGAWTSGEVNGRMLMVLTAAVMLWAGISVVWKLRRTTPDTRMEEDPGKDAVTVRNSIPALGGLGALAGFVAGLLGVGGGIVLVPVLTGPLRVPMRRAVASSLVAVAIFQVPALITHVWLGHVNWAFAIPIMIGVIPGAQVGAHLTVGASDRTIRILFGILVMVIAVVYGATEVRGLVVNG